VHKTPFAFRRRFSSFFLTLTSEWYGQDDHLPRQARGGQTKANGAKTEPFLQGGEAMALLHTTVDSAPVEAPRVHIGVEAAMSGVTRFVRCHSAVPCHAMQS
jgi:hypothetical protein